MEKQIKYKCTDEDYADIDDFLKRFSAFKGDFDFFVDYPSKYKNHPKKSIPEHRDKLYHLVAHSVNIISQHDHNNTRHEFTPKGLEVYEHDGYRNWELFNEDRIKFIRESPELARNQHKNNKRISYITATVAAAGLIISFLNYCEDRNQRKQLKQQLQLTNQQQLQLQTQYDALEGVLSNFLRLQIESQANPSAEVDSTPQPPNHPK